MIVKGTAAHVQELAKYHYRGWAGGVYTHVWTAQHVCREYGPTTAGVIAYSMPVLNSAGRRLATGDFFAGGDKCKRLLRLCGMVRAISRVIVEPRYRGLGLAVRLVQETMPLTGAPIIESTSAMGRACGFFERAGMVRFDLPQRKEAVIFQQMLLRAGIRKNLWIDAEAVQKTIQRLSKSRRDEVLAAMHRFIQPYGRRRTMETCAEMTRFVLSRLCANPAFFIWLSPNKKIEGLVINEITQPQKPDYFC